MLVSRQTLTAWINNGFNGNNNKFKPCANKKTGTTENGGIK